MIYLTGAFTNENRFMRTTPLAFLKEILLLNDTCFLSMNSPSIQGWIPVMHVFPLPCLTFLWYHAVAGISPLSAICSCNSCSFRSPEMNSFDRILSGATTNMRLDVAFLLNRESRTRNKNKNKNPPEAGKQGSNYIVHSTFFISHVPFVGKAS